MKKRNLYLILLCIVTIAAICYGTFIHVGKPLMDISDGSFSFVFGSEGNDKTQEKINAFSSAKIRLNGADVVLSSGDGYSLTYVGEKSRFPAYSVENSVLTVTDPATGDKPTGVLTVTIPESLTDFDELNVSAFGDAVWNIRQKMAVKTINFNSENGDMIFDTGKPLAVDTMTLNSANGDINFEAGDTLSVNTATITSGNGDIYAHYLSCKNSEMISKNGDISISTADDLSQYTFHLKDGYGDISIGDGLYDGSLSSGSEITVGKGGKTMTLRSDNGDITVEKEK